MLETPSHVKSRGWVGPGGKCISWSCLVPAQRKPSTPPTSSVFENLHFLILFYISQIERRICMFSSSPNFQLPWVVQFIKFHIWQTKTKILPSINETPFISSTRVVKRRGEGGPGGALLIDDQWKAALSPSGCLLLLLCNWSSTDQSRIKLFSHSVIKLQSAQYASPVLLRPCAYSSFQACSIVSWLPIALFLFLIGMYLFLYLYLCLICSTSTEKII